MKIKIIAAIAALTINAQANDDDILRKFDEDVAKEAAKDGDALINEPRGVIHMDPETGRFLIDGRPLVQLSSVHRKLAQQCGRTNAAVIEQAPELYPNAEKAAHQMAKMQASMFGLSTKEEVELFIEVAEIATLEQLETLKEIE
jgi:hypothetical protein